MLFSHHLAAYSNLNELYWFDLKYLDKKQENFVKKLKRGAKGGKYKIAEKAYIKDMWYNFFLFWLLFLFFLLKMLCDITEN